MERSTTSRITLLAVILSVVLVIGVGGFVWVRRVATRVLDHGRVALEDGKSVGRSVRAAACLDTAFTRHARQADPSFSDLLNERLFLDGCLTTSQPSADLCVEVPPEGAIARTATWALRQCHGRGLNDRNCPNLLLPLQEYCGRRAARYQ